MQLKNYLHFTGRSLALYPDNKKQNTKPIPSADTLKYFHIFRENNNRIVIRLLARQKIKTKCNPLRQHSALHFEQQLMKS